MNSSSCVIRPRGRSLLFLFLVSAMVFLVSAPVFSADDKAVARLTEFKGTILIKSKGEWGVKPEKDLPLYSDDKVVTRTGEAVVTFEDGGVVEIKSNSNLLIVERDEGAVEKKVGEVKRHIRLLLGKMLFRTGRSSDRRTILETPTAVCGLRGTAGVLSIGADGQAHIQFTEGGIAYSVGDFISGVAGDVPSELADMNPAQRAAFIAAAAADQAANAAEKAKTGEVPSVQAAYAGAQSAEAAAQEAKTAAQGMLNNPDAEIKTQAQTAIDAANKAIEDAKKAQEEAVKQGATPGGLPEAYAPPAGEKVAFNVDAGKVVEDVAKDVGEGNKEASVTTTTVTTTTVTTTVATTVATTVPPTTVPTITGSGSVAGFFMTGALSSSFPEGSNQGTLTLTGSFTGEPPLADTGTIAGTLGDGGQFSGFVGGVLGSWEGVFAGINGNGGSALFLYGDLSGTAQGGTLNASGTMTMTNPMGTFTGNLLDVLGEGPNFPIPLLSDIHIQNGTLLTGGSYNKSNMMTMNVTGPQGQQRVLGVWGASGYGGSYSNDGSAISFMWYQAEGSGGYGGSPSYYMLGPVDVTLDGNQVTIKSQENSKIDYMDGSYYGQMDLAFKGGTHGEGGSYSTAGAGTLTMDYLLTKGQMTWGRFFDFNPETVAPEFSGSINAFLGSTNSLWTGADSTHVLGSYSNPNDQKLFDYNIEGATDGGGKFYLSGGGVITAPDSTFQGIGIGLYIKPNGSGGYEAGYLKPDSINGNIFQDIHMLKASTQLNAVPKGQTSIAPQHLYGGSPSLNASTVHGLVGGSIQGTVKMETLNLSDQPGWGTSMSWLFGSFPKEPTGSWDAMAGGSSGINMDALSLAFNPSTFPGAEVQVGGNSVTVGVANNSGSQPISLHGASAPLSPGYPLYQIGFNYNLSTDDSLIWDSFSVSSSANPFYNLALAEPLTNTSGLALGFYWGGENVGGLESLPTTVPPSGSKTAYLPSFGPSTYLNVYLDTQTEPADTIHPSWGTIDNIRAKGLSISGTDKYWLYQITGSEWSNNRLSGTLTGTYLDLKEMRNLSGQILGAYDPDTYSWAAVSVGTWTGSPLAFSSSFSGDAYSLVPGTVYESGFERKTGQNPDTFDAHFDYSYFKPYSANPIYGERWEDYYNTSVSGGEVYAPSSYQPGSGTKIVFTEDPVFMRTSMSLWTIGSLGEGYFTNLPPLGGAIQWVRRGYEAYNTYSILPGGAFTGILGGTDNLWNAGQESPAQMLLMGRYDPPGGDFNTASLFATELYSSTYTTGGAYMGFLGGAIVDDSEADVAGRFYGLYINDSMEAGILKGTFTGDLYPAIGMWKGDGTVYPVYMGNTSISPADLSAHVDRGFMAGWLAGDFNGAGKISSEIGFGYSYALMGHGDWGIFNLVFGFDNEAVSPASNWQASVAGWGEFGSHPTSGGFTPDIGMWLTDPMNGTASAGKITSDYTGKFLTHSKYGALTGEVLGTYDSNSWQAVAAGAWEKADTQPLKFGGVAQGRLRKMVSEYHLYYGYGSSDYYEYSYLDGVNQSGWSSERDATGFPNIKETHVTYHVGGKTETWTENVTTGALTYSEGTWIGSLDKFLADESSFHGGPASPGPPFYYLRELGNLDALLGGLDDLWNATLSTPANLVMLGEFDTQPFVDHTNPQLVFGATVRSYNPYDGTNTIWNQRDNSQDGAFYGYLGGRVLKGSLLLDGQIGTLYVDKLGNAGILAGTLSGEAYKDLDIFEATGGIFPIQLAQKSVINPIDPTSLKPVTEGGIINEEWSSSDTINSHGVFMNDGVPEGDIHWRSWRSVVSHLKTDDTLDVGGVLYDQYFGVRLSLYGGTYTGGSGGATYDNWHIPFSATEGASKREGYYVGASDTGGKWSTVGLNNVVEGKGFGYWVNWDQAVTGISGADLKGTFDPATHTWQMASLWSYMDTRTFMDMVNKNRLAELQALNIPCIEIGRATLSGSGNNLSVTMADTTFFAYRSGERPRIWATDNVTGTYYTGAPALGVGVNLSQTSGSNANVSATFTVDRWQNPSGVWGANVAGSGTVGAHNVTFGGAAAGGIDTQGAGTFSGTGAGKVAP